MNEHDPDEQFVIFTPHGPAQPERPSKKRIVSRTKECTRCGECCARGGPVLLRDDLPLLHSRLSYEDIYTIREGEPQVSPHDQDVYFSSMELVKIREKPGLSVCRFYSEDEGCRIYSQRPLLCRSYSCWAPEDVVTGIGERALSRQDLFGSVELIADIIARHSEKCNYERLVQAVKKANDGDEEAAEEVADMLQYDAYVRPFLNERFHIPSESLGVILGKPLSETIEPLGIRVRREGEEYLIEKVETREEE